VGYKNIRETCKSDVRLDRTALTINVTAISGPFKTLVNNWRFEGDDNGGCTVHFLIEFEFKSWLLQKVIGAFFADVVGKMVSAFEKRAIQIHGSAKPD
ncbi:MAG: type II toxin-antitoxin system RatA family toxin, partial [Proteobacteria bacterium]|nr:type II toxin-antitoxin system RatA family toxin [Pseudomonadota bacterium]